MVLPLALACALAGCSTLNVSAQSGTPQAGTGVNGGAAAINIQGGPGLRVIAGIATIAALIGISRNSPSYRVPEMLEGRAISEVDCTQPIADWSKNLKCR